MRNKSNADYVVGGLLMLVALIITFAWLNRRPALIFDNQIITRSEYSQFEKGMTREEIQLLIGDPGELFTEATFAGVSTYRWENSDGSAAFVVFKDNKMMSKVWDSSNQ